MLTEQELIEKIRNLKAFKTTVVRCAHCKTWYTRYPSFSGGILDMGDECEKCGCTSFFEVPGRVVGVKSKYFKFWHEELSDYVKNLWEVLGDYEKEMLINGLIFDE